MPDAKVNVLHDGERLAPGVLGRLARVEVRESDADPTVLALRFNLSQAPDGSFQPLDDELFVPAAPLALDVEAPGGLPTRLFQGYVTHLRPHFEPIESNCYLEVLALDAAVLLDAVERVASYPDATDAEAAEEVFGRYGIAFEGEATAARHAADERLLVQRETDWAFVQRLARRNGYACYLEPDPGDGGGGGSTAHFHRPAVGDEPQADLSLFRGATALRWVDLQYAAAGPARSRAAAIDPLAKRLVRSDGEPALAALVDALLGPGLEEAWRAAGAGGAEALLRDPPAGDEALNAAAAAASDRAQLAVEARGELDPAAYRGLLRARRPVLLRDVGRTFAGAYYVRGVRTTLEEGRLSQTFVAVRNALGLAGSEEFGQVAEEVEAQ